MATNNLNAQNSSLENNNFLENKFGIEVINKSLNNINYLENLKWFDANVDTPQNIFLKQLNPLFNCGRNKKLQLKIGIGRVPFGRANAGNLQVKLLNTDIDTLAKFNVIEKNIDHLN